MENPNNNLVNGKRGRSGNSETSSKPKSSLVTNELIAHPQHSSQSGMTQQYIDRGVIEPELTQQMGNVKASTRSDPGSSTAPAALTNAQAQSQAQSQANGRQTPDSQQSGEEKETYNTSSSKKDRSKLRKGKWTVRSEYIFALCSAPSWFSHYCFFCRVKKRNTHPV
jgi:hypothetical protein